MSYERDSFSISWNTLTGFQKCGANLDFDLLIFEFWAPFCPKNHQIPQKVIAIFIKN